MSRKHLIAIALLGVAIFLAYSNSLSGTWAMDDIVAGRPVALKDIKDFIGFRKIAYLTFLINQSIAPFSPVSFRLFNILIHILNTALVYVIAYKTMSFRLTFNSDGLKLASGYQDPPPLNPRPSREGNRRSPFSIGVSGAKTEELSRIDSLAFYTAIFSGVLFGLHPININAVAYIVQRMASLATLFVLLSLLCYVFATQSGNRRKSFLLYALSGISVIAGIFSKENAVMALPLVLIYDYIFLSRFKWIVFRKRMLVVFGMGILSIGTAFALLKMYPAFLDVARLFFSPTQPMTAKSWMAGDVYWTPLQHILTELRVISRYLFLILIPLPQFLIFDWWGFTVSKSLTEPITTLFSITAVISLLIFAIWKIKRFPMLCFGILWYFSAISLESFFALGSDLYFEHRNYLPSAGLFIGIAGQITISLRTKLNQKAVFTAIIICGLILGLLTFSRNFVWKDSITLWGDTLRKVPSNIRAMMAMGNAHFKLSDMGTAERYYKEALRASSRDQRLHYLDDSVYSLGMLYLFTGKLQEARDLIEKYEKSIESYRPKILKGFYMASNNDIDEALVTYKEVLDKARGVDSVVLHTLMGDAYRKKGLWDKALEEYGEAILLDPGFSAAYYGTGVVLMNKRDIVRAHEYFEKTLSIDPDNVLALSDMADLMLIRKENSREALNYAERAVSKNPSFYQPYLTMGNVLIVLGREQEAEEFYKKAVEYGLADYMVPFSKARAYYMKGDEEQAQRQLAELGKFKNLPDKMRELIREQR